MTCETRLEGELFGTGDGRFTPGLDDTTASVVGDLNGDGAMDLVLTVIVHGLAITSEGAGLPRRAA